MGVKNLIQHYRFTSMADGELTAAVKDIPIDQYMLKYRFAVSQQQDCFTKMQTLLAAQSAPVSQCVIGSRYASLQGTITDQRAHPIHSESGKFSLFHNGFISNFKELCGANSDQTDSEVIASLIEECLLQGHTLQQAVKQVCECKLQGTWRLAVLGENVLVLATNSGDLYLGRSGANVLFCSEQLIQSEAPEFKFEKLKQNQMYVIEIDTLAVSETPLVRKTQMALKNTYLEEIKACVQTAQWVTDFGAKFIAEDQVCLGGFDKASEELHLIQNLVIAANGSSHVAAEYGAFILKHLEIFNSVKVHSGLDISLLDLQRVKFAGYLTLSQSGQSQHLIKGVQEAISLGITCMNVVNCEDSPLTRVVSEQADVKNQEWLESENIGMFMKSGFCYSDVKSFIPEVISMALVALWFSHNKNPHVKEIKQRREKLVSEIMALPGHFEHLLSDKHLLEQYEKISEVLKNHHNLFVLAKGSGWFAANFIAQKFLQVSGLHAEAYPCAEFRHGPLSMIDENEKTPVVFILLDDEHRSQILSNILQVKERGATTIIVTNNADLSKLIDMNKLDFVVQMPKSSSPQDGDTFAALQAVVPLQMICYQTTVKRGLNPDQQLAKSIDFAHEE